MTEDARNSGGLEAGIRCLGASSEKDGTRVMQVILDWSLLSDEPDGLEVESKEYRSNGPWMMSLEPSHRRGSQTKGGVDLLLETLLPRGTNDWF